MLKLEMGTGSIVTLPGAASTVLAADPRIARVQPASATSLFVMGVAPGRTTVIATGETGMPIAEYDVTVVSSPAAEAAQAPDGRDQGRREEGRSAGPRRDRGRDPQDPAGRRSRSAWWQRRIP